ncbi:hypothetical protein ASE75_00790 [Sphingomonas sp. Leaf17]|uniref:tetratricopeptide repeat protein n=1 Tax=Sphingomonas sp. Leaf17 TaxID=1735683 RepID=UPI0006F61D24|nr:SPOR domain-containing protein [Sphingomonas sp. Leaf17]KQM67522.1 hypothetical protein ASE75_00790 [Sphingomonas sp. Leaf17]
MRHSLRPLALLSAAPLAIALPIALVAMPTPIMAQGLQMVQPLNTDADKLGVVMRRLATAPNDADALVTAGELSLKLDDLRAAAAFFARAEKADPRNARVKAGMASILVRSERPGEALRYFAQAQSLGLDPGSFAGDRALAYDLIGEQDRAQRDYRLALSRGGDDETLRRYALSLGISGNQPLALQQIDTLVRRQDRGAWRARAFILAMTGDQAGATKIATTMMPGALGSGLQPFFERLPTLPAADRAFAVHFGEVRPTPERLADARMVPPLPALGRDPTAPMMAATTPVAPVRTAAIDPKRNRGRTRDDRRAQRGTSAPAQTAPVQMAATTAGVPGRVPLAASTVTTVASPMQMVQSLPTATARVEAVQPGVTATPAASPSSPVPGGRPLGPGFAGQAGSSVAASGAATRPQADGTLAASTVAQLAAIPVRPETPQQTMGADTRPGFASTGPVASGMSVSRATTPSQPNATSLANMAAMTPASASGPQSASPAVAAQSTAPATGPEAMPPATRGDDAILARIVAGLSMPMADLTIDPNAATSAPPVAAAVTTPTRVATRTAPVRTSPARTVTPRTTAAVTDDPPAPARSTRATRAKLPAAMPAEPVEAVAVTPRLSRRQAARAAAAAARENAEADALAEAEAAPKTSVKKSAKALAAEKKLLADKKAAADKKVLADKAAAEEKKLAKADPERIWVQVAGGANANDLPKAWSSVQAKAAALKGRPAYATPLRATNRVVTGPFKTEAEARTFVNTLAKQGVSAFTFTSDKGQKLTKLPTK